ncbi:hypothetical protein OPAG_00238 [Rhodococcus opacus PD630]|uniref:vWA domain-containing protein n=1 Tax=Rhodococcus opacus TaxID=37919 RepID=UPI00029CAFD6|nr:vWA domain-containing protein [Rhodococcus opacus]EHI41012.1 hypothetical protein OPAG_00238 [Rhodococcus opacus PD630]UDG95351.1 VWA domain-containing protein [Rhodococcus opacus PD630]
MKKVAALAALMLVPLMLAMPSASAAPTTAAVGDFGGCLAAQQQGDLLLMVDQSGSLQGSDPDAARVSAANYLLEQLNTFGGSAGVELNVAIAGFSENFIVHAPWTRLDNGSLPALQGEVERFRTRTDGIDTDYWNALDGARRTLAERDGQSETNRCQAVAWFSDGKLDFTVRDAEKPYAQGVSLGSDQGVQQVVAAARESICRPAGIADQLRSSGIVTFAVGLAAGTAQPSDFDLMRSIATGGDGACGKTTSPSPGDFYLAQNIDDLLFAFDAFSTPGQAPIEGETGVCVVSVCEEAQHRFVLDDSISSVTVLGSADAEGLIPTLVAPSGAQLALDREGAPRTATLDGAQVAYRWMSPRSVSFTMTKSDDSAQWQGMWALVFVDPDGSSPLARSKTNIHISGNLFPAWLGMDTTAVHSGEKTSAIRLGIVDSDRNEIDPSDLLGSAALSVSLTDAGNVDHPLVDRIAKERIGDPVELDFTEVPPGAATLRLTLDVTTADARSSSGEVIAPGTALTPQFVDVPLTVAPPIGYPAVPSKIDFGTVEGAGQFAATIPITGPGCVWFDQAAPVALDAVPDGVGDVGVSAGTAPSAADCLEIGEGRQANLPVDLSVPAAGNGSLNGSIPLMMSPPGEPDRALPITVAFTAELQKPLNSGRFWLVFLLVLLVSIAVPPLVLYGIKWWTARIPAKTLKAMRVGVTIEGGQVLRDGVEFGIRESDLSQLVRGLNKPARSLDVESVELRTRIGLSPFGPGYVVAQQPGLVAASGAEPPVDRRTGGARLPLAIHNNWVVLHDPAGPANLATVLLLVGGDATEESNRRLVADLVRKLPGRVAELRADHPGTTPTATTPSAPSSSDPFGAPSAPTFGAAPSWDAAPTFGGTAPSGSAAPARSSAGDPFDPFRPPGS